jgi:hypothetical protein
MSVIILIRTLRLPLYILSAVDAYQKAYGTGKRVMMMMVVVVAVPRKN